MELISRIFALIGNRLYAQDDAIMLKKIKFCGNCMMKMNPVKENMFRCPQCGMTYEDQEL
tara:strand:+ start:354 stop:533 length:180 start_codon:yes stop_codon:yes gene_type:complete